MTTLAEHIIVAGAENRPPMLEKSMYDSWASRIHLFIKGKKHGRIMLDLIDNGLLVYPTVEENGQTRPKKYSKLTEAQQLQDYYDVQATNIILHGLPPDGETLYEYYWRFSQLINDMHTIRMTMKQVQVNTKFLNALLSEWSMFVTHQGEDPIESINKAMAFLSTMASRFPPSNNQLRTSSNPRNQATIQDGRVIVQQVQGRQSQSFAGTGNRGIATTSRGTYAASQPRTEDLDAYESDCDDLSSVKVVLMENLSSCDSDVLSEVLYFDSSPNDMINQIVQEMQYSKQTQIDDFQDNEIHSDSNITLYSQYLQESQDAVIQDTNSAPNDLLVLFLVEQMTDHVAHLDKENQTNKMLNKIKEDFGKHFVTKKELPTKQAFWLKHSSFSKTPVTSHTPVRIEAPSELPKVSLVNESLKKLKYQLANFDKVVKKRTTSDAITASDWGFEHTKASFVTEIIRFLNVLKDTFKSFDKTLLDEIIEVQTVFNQMEANVDQCYVDKNAFEIQIKQLSIDNDQLLKQILSQEIMHIALNSVDILDVKKSRVNECNKCLEHETELLKKKDVIEKDVYDKLLKTYSTLEKHCISLELTTQLNQEIFQKDNFCENQNVPSFNQLFEINELKAHSQEKDTLIRKLKDRIKSLSEKDNVENVKKDIDEIEMINIELEHSVAKLLSENKNLRKEREHLKSIYKDQFDSIRKTHVQSKEHCDSLIAQINAKSVANSDLNGGFHFEKMRSNTLLTY
ncbi:hypothetical protein Tco_0238641 [Tanacetum coccineum]